MYEVIHWGSICNYKRLESRMSMRRLVNRTGHIHAHGVLHTCATGGEGPHDLTGIGLQDMLANMAEQKKPNIKERV